MPNFAYAIAELDRLEGKRSTDPADRGGDTYRGISKRWWGHRFPTWPPADADVDTFYRERWRQWTIDLLPECIGVKVFLFAVHADMPDAARTLQRAIRACGRKVEADGVMGPATLRAAHAADPGALAAAFRAEQAAHYRREVERDSSQARFLNGWLSRAYDD